MGKPLSMDLRDRVIEAIDSGMSRRAAARRYGVSAASAIRWDLERRSTGSYAPKTQGGDKRSHRIDAHASLIHGALEETPDITLAELRAYLAKRGVGASVTALWRFLKRHGISRKKRPGTRSNKIAQTS